MSENQHAGASASEWAQAASQDIMAPWILPVVSNLQLKISPQSVLKTPGKVPSCKNARGEIVGIAGWTGAPEATMQQLDTWSRDPDLGFCVRTGHGGLLAIDCDVNDPQLADAIERLLLTCCHIDPESFTKRQRGTARWATLIHITGDGADRPRAKTVINMTTPGADKAELEILAAGQQLVCAGTHPKGTRYTWTNGIYPLEVSAADFDTFVFQVATFYGTTAVTEQRPRTRERGETFAAPDRLADWLHETGRVLGSGRNGELYIRCPWESEHTASSGPAETVYFPVGSNGYAQGGFKCLHAHCAHRGLPEFLEWAKAQGFTATTPEAYPNETAGNAATAEPDAGARLMLYRNEKTGYIDPCATAVYIAVGAPEIAGYSLAYDTFRGRIVARRQDGDTWEPFPEERNLELRINLERYGFKPGRVSKDLIADAVKLVASEHKVDTMADYLERTLPTWDGVPRAERFLATYCGAEDNEYTRAVGRYFWGLLWRRAAKPQPIKADISLVLIGAQGANKTRFIKEIALQPEYHTELNFNLSAAELSMRMGGRVLAEFPEMVGFGKRKLEEIKAFLTIDADTYRPLYSSDQRTVTRRCLFVMTTNNTAFLSDRTGNRRYAPVEVGSFQADAIKPDLLQLWAEGKAIFEKYGGLKLHQDVEALTENLNERYVLPDSWETAVGDWLTAQDAMPEADRASLQSRTILALALGFDDKQVKRDDLARLSEIMQALGYSYGLARVAGKVVKTWRKK